MDEHPEKLDTGVQYESMVTFSGSNILTGDGGEGYMETRKLGDVEDKDALWLYDEFEKLRVDAEARFKPKRWVCFVLFDVNNFVKKEIWGRWIGELKKEC
jgi:hypothetical protein